MKLNAAELVRLINDIENSTGTTAMDYREYEADIKRLCSIARTFISQINVVHAARNLANVKGRHATKIAYNLLAESLYNLDQVEKLIPPCNEPS